MEFEKIFAKEIERGICDVIKVAKTVLTFKESVVTKNYMLIFQNAVKSFICKPLNR